MQNWNHHQNQIVTLFPKVSQNFWEFLADPQERLQKVNYFPIFRKFDIYWIRIKIEIGRNKLQKISGIGKDDIPDDKLLFWNRINVTCTTSNSFIRQFFIVFLCVKFTHICSIKGSSEGFVIRWPCEFVCDWVTFQALKHFLEWTLCQTASIFLLTLKSLVL